MFYRNKLAWIVAPFLGFFMACFGYWLYTVNLSFDYMCTSAQLKNGIPTKTTVGKYFSRLDGKAVNIENEQYPNVVAIMIDNHIDARPQFGLDQAKIIYEAPVEGNITRLMAIFAQAQQVEQVGPVRSARTYFIDWLDEYQNTMYMHSGGSPEALKFLKSNKFLFYNVDEFSYENYYWRDSSHNAPHNLFSSSKKWQAMYLAITEKEEIKKYDSWKFSEKIITTSTQDVSSISIPFNKEYIVKWKYNSSSKLYQRYINEKEHKVNNNKQLTSRNILIQFVNTKIIDNEGRRSMQTTGSGEARILRDGKLIWGKWIKSDREAQTKFYDNNDYEVSLSSGNTWVEVVPSLTALTVGN